MPYAIKSPQTLEELTERERIIGLLSETGVSTGDIAIALEIHPDSVSRLKKRVRQTGLTQPQLVKSAEKAVKNILKGKTWGTLTEIKASDVMAAVREVKDRHEPKISRHETLNINLDIDPVVLERYRR